MKYLALRAQRLTLPSGRLSDDTSTCRPSEGLLPPLLPWLPPPGPNIRSIPDKNKHFYGECVSLYSDSEH